MESVKTALNRRCDECTFSLGASTNFERSKIQAKYVLKLEVGGGGGWRGDEAVEPDSLGICMKTGSGRMMMMT